jgi:predicted nucleotide-binding protein
MSTQTQDPVVQNQQPITSQDPKATSSQDQQTTISHDQQTTVVQDQQTTTSQDLTLKTLNQGISKSVVGIMDDMLAKPDDQNWPDHIKSTFLTEDRITFIGILFIMLALLIYIYKKA